MANARTYPNLNVVGHHGYFAEDEEEKILEQTLLKPSLLLVALGCRNRKNGFNIKKSSPCVVIVEELTSWRCNPAGACMDAKSCWRTCTAFEGPSGQDIAIASFCWLCLPKP